MWWIAQSHHGKSSHSSICRDDPSDQNDPEFPHPRPDLNEVPAAPQSLPVEDWSWLNDVWWNGPGACASWCVVQPTWPSKATSWSTLTGRNCASAIAGEAGTWPYSMER
jgi:hypothetical protein